MANREAFQEMFDSILEGRIEDIIKVKGYESIIFVSVYRKIIKEPVFLFFHKRKEIEVVEFTIHEDTYIMESITTDIDLRELAKIASSIAEIKTIYV